MRRSRLGFHHRHDRRSGAKYRGAGAWALAFASTLYLGFSGGGFDELVWGQVGLALWWLVLLGAAVGVLPALGLGRSGWVALGALGALAAWTALGIGWGGAPSAAPWSWRGWPPTSERLWPLSRRLAPVTGGRSWAA